jgi:hypothetical protein
VTGRPTVVIGDDVTLDRHRPAVTFGPRPPEPPRSCAARERRVPPAVGRVAAAGAALLVGLLAGWATISPAPAGPRPPADSRPPVEHAPSCPGCGRNVAWYPDRGEVIVRHGASRSRYAVGRPGDHLLVGDWDGDGRDAAALYRPSTGEVLRFDRWATVDDPPPVADRQATGITGGSPRLVRLDGHDEVVVDPPST